MNGTKIFRAGLPYFTAGKVVKGFGRGSKELGIPTANLPQDVVDSLPREISTGIYFGWATVNGGPVYKMVMSVGWNPYYKNMKRSMETHILHTFSEDFYGSRLSVCMLGYIRPERNFSSLDELITAVKADISEADKKLELPEFESYRYHPFWTSEENNLKGQGKTGMINGCAAADDVWT